MNIYLPPIESHDDEGASGLSEAEKIMIQERLDDYEKHPDAGSSWEDVKRRLESNS